MLETFGQIAEKHGPWAVFCLGLLAILYFVGKRAVASVDRLTLHSAANHDAMAKSITTATTSIARSISETSRAQIEAFGAVSQRIARIEGRLGVVIREPRGTSARKPIQEHVDEDDTPIGGPFPDDNGARGMTPAHGVGVSGYRPPRRPPTDSGGDKR